MKDKESDYKNSAEKLKALEVECGKLWDDLKIITAERDNLKSMNASFKNRLMDVPGLNMQDMMNNLLNIDPNEFRKTMYDLEFDGQDPLWAKMDFVEQTGMVWNVDQTNLKALINEVDWLKMDKRDLAAELEKT